MYSGEDAACRLLTAAQGRVSVGPWEAHGGDTPALRTPAHRLPHPVSTSAGSPLTTSQHHGGAYKLTRAGQLSSLGAKLPETCLGPENQTRNQPVFSVRASGAPVSTLQTLSCRCTDGSEGGGLWAEPGLGPKLVEMIPVNGVDWAQQRSQHARGARYLAPPPTMPQSWFRL